MAKNNNSGSDRMRILINDRRKIIEKLSDEICESDESESYLVAAKKINQIKELEKEIKTFESIIKCYKSGAIRDE